MAPTTWEAGARFCGDLSQPLSTQVAVLRRPFPTLVDPGRGSAETFPNPCRPGSRFCGDLPQHLSNQVAVLRRPFPTPVEPGRGSAETFPNPCRPRSRSCGDLPQPLSTEVAILRRPSPTGGRTPSSSRAAMLTVTAMRGRHARSEPGGRGLGARSWFRVGARGGGLARLCPLWVGGPPCR